MIKIILFIPLLLLILLVLPRFRSHTASRLLMVAISLLGILFVLFPSIPDRLAHLVGVGRGADLVIYLFMVIAFLFGILIYAKVRKLNEDQSELVKQIAIQQAKNMADEKPNDV